MKRKSLLWLLLIVSLSFNLIIGLFYGEKIVQTFSAHFSELSPFNQNKSTQDLKVYYSPAKKDILGRYHNDDNFYRLPESQKTNVRTEVWGLSRNSSGLYLRFSTNSTEISVKWTLSSPLSYLMSNIGANGIDLYGYRDSMWHFVNAGVPEGTINEYSLIDDMDNSRKEFMLYLPLYNSVQDISIGVDQDASLTFISDRGEKPLVFYGTSITQGKSASRPGMAYPSIISRSLNKESINLGFSGNGKFEKAIGDILCDIDAALYVIDCTPNSSPQTINQNALKLIRQMKDCQPGTPIILVESIEMEFAHFKRTDKPVTNDLRYVIAQNTALKKAYEQAKTEGIENLYYIESGQLIGTDHEGTIDGIHLNDLGMMRMAEAIKSKIISILEIDVSAVQIRKLVVEEQNP